MAHPGRGEGSVGLGGAVREHRPAQVVEHHHRKARRRGVQGGPAHAEVARQPADPDPGDAARREQRRQPGGPPLPVRPQVLAEGAVRVDVGRRPLAQEQGQPVERQAGVQARPGRALDAVLGPQGLLAAVQRERRERRLAVAAGERDVARRVPVLGRHHGLEARQQRRDRGHHLIAGGHRQGAARHEVGLQIDYEQRVLFAVQVHGALAGRRLAHALASLAWGCYLEPDGLPGRRGAREAVSRVRLSGAREQLGEAAVSGGAQLEVAPQVD